ncbi:hypothetical protein AAZX31_04G144500 [Glycine max]|nr:hypothetical protein GLYMA_04G158166v4 [Glycine max]KAH1111567.1 hypothetical protein GYH30_010092 [Glycine max]
MPLGAFTCCGLATPFLLGTLPIRLLDKCFPNILRKPNSSKPGSSRECWEARVPH